MTDVQTDLASFMAVESVTHLAIIVPWLLVGRSLRLVCLLSVAPIRLGVSREVILGTASPVGERGDKPPRLCKAITPARIKHFFNNLHYLYLSIMKPCCLRFVELNNQMEQLTKMYDTFPESCGDWAFNSVGFMLHCLVLCWQSVFEVGTSCTI